ncbi:hypothetical protein [Streptomyces sp. BP-8]|uniref:Integral membrane protein n=1 Tax=Streptomyces sirii TaxID=3127701 RepID=A0ABZ2QM96_9ACTN
MRKRSHHQRGGVTAVPTGPPTHPTAPPGPLLTSLLGHGLLIVGALSSHLTVIGWFTPPEAVRRRAVRAGAAYALAPATVIVLFLRTPLPGEHPNGCPPCWTARPPDLRPSGEPH